MPGESEGARKERERNQRLAEGEISEVLRYLLASTVIDIITQ